MNPNNTIGFCREHRRGHVVKKFCGVCNKPVRADNNLGFCRKHRSGVPDRFCVMCETKLRRDNTTGYCRKHVAQSPHRKSYIREYEKRNPEKFVRAKEKWRKNNGNIWFYNKLKTDIQFRLRHNMKRRLRRITQKRKYNTSSIDYLGCSYTELQQHLEALFEPGMSWDNYGEWHIDHIYPLSKVDLTDEDQVNKYCHFSNLQPLWAKDNQLKSDKTEYNFPTSVRHPKRKQG